MNVIQTFLGRFASASSSQPPAGPVRYASPNAVSSTKIGKDGTPFFIRDWPLLPEATPRGMVLIVHALGEHIGRYDHVADQLNQWGFAVRGYDQYGHGRTGGTRGGLPRNNQLLEDLADIVDDTRKHTDPDTPLILLGHSMGGLLAMQCAGLNTRRIDGLILSSPALDTGISAIQKLLLAIIPAIAPHLRVGNGVDARYLSHDAQVVQHYAIDPLCHDRISTRLARFMTQTGNQMLTIAPHWKTPTLLLYAGDERILDAMGSTRFAKLAPQESVTAQKFDNLYHEIFNELDATVVFDSIKKWLDLRF